MILDEELEISNWKINYGCSELEYEIDGDCAQVRAINANPSGCGIGTMLCQKFEEIAESKNCKIIEVPVSLTSEALCFWRAMGYELQNKRDRRKMNRIIETDITPKDDPHGIIVMQKRLAG